ncbi:MAG: Ig-like domain-containing protein [Clostridia bacterium]|nr:Ig-like domain-containing protein [Clostridia bacterium]
MKKKNILFPLIPVAALLAALTLVLSSCTTGTPEVTTGAKESTKEPSATFAASASPTVTASPTATDSPTDKQTLTPFTPTPFTPTQTATVSPTPTPTPTPPETETPVPTQSETPTPTPVRVTGVTVSPAEITLTVGESFDMKIAVLPGNADDRRVTCGSSDPSVASCENGRVTAKSAGGAVLTVKTVDGGFTATCAVTVKEKEQIPNAFRYGEDGLPTYTPHFEEGVEYYDFNPKNTYHLFCHNLVAFDDPDDYFFSDCITVTEFKRILESLYARDYVLIDVDYMYDYYYNAEGLLCARIKESIRLPKGKKAIILSVDNVAYPRGEHGRGRCDRLQVVDGKLVTFTKLSDGSNFYSDDNEVFPILENFIAAHPDFSFSGARCVVAPSGYEGLFGWDTIPGSANYEESVAECKKIVRWFNEHGYTFACHSYYHKNFNTMTADQVRDDRAHWMAECYPIVGRTHVFIYPFGAFTNPKEENGLRNAHLLHEEGYAVFCATSYLAPNWNNFPLEGNCYNERVTLAAKLFTVYPNNETLAKLFDVYEVYDNAAHIKKLTR